MFAAKAVFPADPDPEAFFPAKCPKGLNGGLLTAATGNAVQFGLAGAAGLFLQNDAGEGKADCEEEREEVQDEDEEGLPEEVPSGKGQVTFRKGNSGTSSSCTGRRAGAT